MANAKHDKRAEQSADHPKEKVAGKWIYNAKAERANWPARQEVYRDLADWLCHVSKAPK